MSKLQEIYDVKLQELNSIKKLSVINANIRRINKILEIVGDRYTKLVEEKERIETELGLNVEEQEETE
jgi:cell shape-determining protein MreC